MSGTRDRSSFDLLAWVLGECRTDRVTGSLYLAGRPGGVFHLRNGAVVAVDTPGAPGAHALLLRSGRISEADWSAVVRAGADPHGELLARAGIGGTELHLITSTAAHDGAFAVVAGTIDEYAVDHEPLDVPLPITRGIDLDRLLAETARRLDALASLPTPVAPHRERLEPAADPRTAALNAMRRAIIACADGRRCARDIAFVLGRNVFPVTVEVSRMVGDGLLAVAGAAAVGAPRPHPQVQPRVRETGPRPPLPRREPGASGVNESRFAGWPVLPRLFTRARAGPGAAEDPPTP
ncbi:hypothetical protein ACWEVP_30105 [Amycolatopsis sp. NPDC003865]